MKITRRRWADSFTPYTRVPFKMPWLGVNWRGYVYVSEPK